MSALSVTSRRCAATGAVKPTIKTATKTCLRIMPPPSFISRCSPAQALRSPDASKHAHVASNALQAHCRALKNAQAMRIPPVHRVSPLSTWLLDSQMLVLDYESREPGTVSCPSRPLATSPRNVALGIKARNPMPTITQIELVQKTFAIVAPIADDVAALFYRRLFEIDPSLESMFKGNAADQRRKL